MKSIDIEHNNIEDVGGGDLNVGDVNFSLYRNLSGKYDDKNLLFSNAGIEAVMELARLAANSNTKKQIEKVFGINERDLTSDAVNIYNFMVTNETNDYSKTKDSYIKKIETLPYIKANIYKLNDLNEADNLVNTINKKISDVTNGQIKNAVDKMVYTEPLFKAQLANVIHFLGKWKYSGDSGYTKETLYFNNIDKTKIPTDFFLTRTNDSDLYENDKLIAFTLDYKESDGRYEFVAVLPKNSEDNIDDADFRGLKSYKDEYIIDTTIPCFEFDTDLELNEALKRLGVTDLFDIDKADLSNAFENISANTYISEVTQKAKIKVDECGTEASAFTSAIAMNCSAMPEKKPQKKVRYVKITLNRPFIFMIYDKVEDMPLFIGNVKYTNDNKEKVFSYNDVKSVVDEIIEVDIDEETKNGK